MRVWWTPLVLLVPVLELVLSISLASACDSSEEIEPIEIVPAHFSISELRLHPETTLPPKVTDFTTTIMHTTTIYDDSDENYDDDDDDINADTITNSNADGTISTNTDTGADTNTNSDTETDTNTGNGNEDTETDGNSVTDADADVDTNAYATTASTVDVTTDTNTDTDAETGTDTENTDGVTDGNDEGTKEDRPKTYEGTVGKIGHRYVADSGQCEFEISCGGSTGVRPVLRSTKADSGAESGKAEAADENKYDAKVLTRASAALRLAMLAPSGPRGPPGEKGERGEPGVEGEPGSDGWSLEPMVKTAFFVGLVENFGPFNRPEDVRFDKVVTNVGAAYNFSTGRFVAPHSGTYAFHVTIAAQGDHRAAVRLLVKSADSRDSRIVFTMWCESIPFWSSTSNNAILKLGVADQVWVRSLSTASAIHGYMYSTFSGHALFGNDAVSDSSSLTSESELDAAEAEI